MVQAGVFVVVGGDDSFCFVRQRACLADATQMPPVVWSPGADWNSLPFFL